MKTTYVSLIGDPHDSLYQLGLRERNAYAKLQDRVTRLLSTNSLLRYGQKVLSKVRILLHKTPHSHFDRCVKAYAEGLGVDPREYLRFLSLFEMAAHYGQIFPELKSLLPGCSSILSKTPEGMTHSRMLDFPLVGI